MHCLDCDEQDAIFLKKRERRARKEHMCCECEEIIPIGVRYLYFVGRWVDPFQVERIFADFKMCRSCNKDWETVINVFHQNEEKGVCIIFGELRETIENAFDYGFLKADSPPVQRWFPGVIDLDPKTEEETEADFWKTIEADAISKGLQPALPFELFKKQIP